MPTEGLQKKFSLLMSNVHKRVFKPLGYKKVGQNIQLITPGKPITKGSFIDFQKSQWNDESELCFTMNIHKGYAYYPNTNPRNPYDFYALRRPQNLSPNYHGDQWWAITPQTDMEKLENEIVGFAQEYVIPYLS